MLLRGKWDEPNAAHISRHPAFAQLPLCFLGIPLNRQPGADVKDHRVDCAMFLARVMCVTAQKNCDRLGSMNPERCRMT
ncbi:hypothetical protein FEMY_20710 [Ferrovum myxofaciens]|uniref:Uncharacterized protein n=1 Tax=Ferrovum myxofaciens TaxID=416213 RepID=A0A149VVZ2_9PROT|nr:hypothetical protein FEMY_20710 [Ferrovum myxofaciens]